MCTAILTGLKLLLFFLASIFWILFVVIPLWFYRQILSFIFWKNLVDLTSSVYFRNNNGTTDYLEIMFHVIVDGNVPPELLKEIITKDIVNDPLNWKLKMHAKLFGGYPVWVPESNFSIDNHFTVVTIQDTALNWIRENVHDPFPDGISRWRFYVSYTPEGSTHIFFKMHHILGDGVSIFRILTTAFDPTIKVTKPVVMNRVADKANLIFSKKALWKTFLDFLNNPTFGSTDVPRIKYSNLCTETTGGFAQSKEIDFLPIKQASKELKVSCNSLIIDCIMRGLNKSNGKVTLDSFPIKFTVPNPKRRDGKNLRNDFFYATCHFENNASLQDIDKELVVGVRKAWLTTKLALVYLRILPTKLLQKMITISVVSRNEGFISIFPGPPDTLSVMKQKISKMTYLIHAPFLPLMMCIFTYRGKLSFWLFGQKGNSLSEELCTLITIELEKVGENSCQ